MGLAFRYRSGSSFCVPRKSFTMTWPVFLYGKLQLRRRRAREERGDEKKQSRRARLPTLFDETVKDGHPVRANATDVTI
jgi:hypothetical protein